MSPLLDHLRKMLRNLERRPPYTRVETYGAMPCRSYLPKEAGDYNVVVDGLKSFKPIFIYFDGKRWDEEALQRHENIAGVKREVRWFPDDPRGGPYARGTEGGVRA